MPLNAQFLPVGSIVNHNNTPLIVMGLMPPEPRQDERFNNKWIVCTSWFNTTLDSCEPIPLTPEILTEWCLFNYENLSGNDCYDNGYMLVRIKDNILTISYVGTDISIKMPPLHIFQMLYSSLTQTVLTVKIK